MWPFKRKQSKQSPIPSEVQDYYQAERRERVGVAWLLALATLVTTILLAFGLFFGGRWVYRKIFNNDKPNTITTTQNGSNSQPPTDNPQPAGTNQPSPNSSSTNPNPTPTTSNPQAGATTPSPSPSTGTSNSSSIPNTGSGNTVAIFLGTSAVAAIGHHLVTKRKLRKEA